MRVSPFTFPGYRVQLRPIRTSDVDGIMTWVNNPQITRNFAGMSRQITREEELVYLEGMIRSKTDRLYALETTDGEYLGNAGLHKIYWPARNGRVGLVVGNPKAQGKGIGQQAMRLILALGFLELGLHKVWLIHFSTNGRMKHIAEKTGFIQEGHLRDEYFHADAFHDMIRHAMLAPEFEERRAAWGMVPTGPAPS